jgi:hypothetical protein
MLAGELEMLAAEAQKSQICRRVQHFNSCGGLPSAGGHIFSPHPLHWAKNPRALGYKERWVTVDESVPFTAFLKPHKLSSDPPEVHINTSCYILTVEASLAEWRHGGLRWAARSS